MRRGVGRSLPVSYSLPHFGGFYKGEFVGSSPLSLASLASSPEGGAKRTAVKPGKRVVRQSRREVRLTTTWPTPTGVLLPPPVGEVAQDAQADCDGEGNRQAQRHKEHIRAPQRSQRNHDLYIHNEKNEMPAKEAFRCFRGFCWVWGRAHFLALGARFLGAGASAASAAPSA